MREIGPDMAVHLRRLLVAIIGLVLVMVGAVARFEVAVGALAFVAVGFGVILVAARRIDPALRNIMDYAFWIFAPLAVLAAGLVFGWWS